MYNDVIVPAADLDGHGIDHLPAVIEGYGEIQLEQSNFVLNVLNIIFKQLKHAAAPYRQF